jgi:hypothetical protein
VSRRHNSSPSNMSSRSSSIAKRRVLQLYRECLRSAYRIPDGSQRATYLDYTRQGFRDRARLPHDTNEALRAIRNAEEQLERMNYYHSIRDIKEQAKPQLYDTNIATMSTATTPQASTSQQQDLADVSDGSDPQPKSECHHKISAQALSAIDQEVDNGEVISSRLHIPKAWLSVALPDLYPCDLAAYSKTLIQDGFDSTSLLDNDIVQDDLNFMKKAHKRALVRFYNIP